MHAIITKVTEGNEYGGTDLTEKTRGSVSAGSRANARSLLHRYKRWDPQGYIFEVEEVPSPRLRIKE